MVYAHIVSVRSWSTLADGVPAVHELQYPRRLYPLQRGIRTGLRDYNTTWALKKK